MAKCKWCGENGPVNKHGYCANCNDTIREEILRNKDILQELSKKASPFLPDDEKNAIFKDAQAAYNALLEFKRKQVPFFKSDPAEQMNVILNGLGLPSTIKASIDSETPDPVSNQPAISSTQHKQILKLSLIISIVFIVVVSSIFTISLKKHSSSSESFDEERHRKVSLIVAAQEAVKEQLKSPSSAEFPVGFDEYTILEIPELQSSYYINGYVDAPNSFGVMLRSNFSVKITYLWNQEKYRILDVQID